LGLFLQRLEPVDPVGAPKSAAAVGRIGAGFGAAAAALGLGTAFAFKYWLTGRLVDSPLGWVGLGLTVSILPYWFLRPATPAGAAREAKS
jgi:hypothetical protein